MMEVRDQCQLMRFLTHYCELGSVVCVIQGIYGHESIRNHKVGERIRLEMGRF
jgi:hypothetical protein